MTGTAALIGSLAALLWVGFAFFAVLILRGLLARNHGPLTKLGLGPSGVTFEFAEAKLDEVVSRSEDDTKHVIGDAAKRSVIKRMQRNSALLSRARILWVDDHPENNRPIVELLHRFGASVDTPKSNPDALRLLQANRYDVVISDVGRDDEGAGSDLKGVELADEVVNRSGLRTLLFTARFNPATLPGASDAERLALVQRMRRSVFASTNRMDEVLHYVLDMLER